MPTQFENFCFLVVAIEVGRIILHFEALITVKTLINECNNIEGTLFRIHSTREPYRPCIYIM